MPVDVEAHDLPLLGERPAVELANSLYEGEEVADALADPAIAQAWVEAVAAGEGWDPPAPHSPPDVAALRGLRDAVRVLLLAVVHGRPPDPAAHAAAVRTLNDDAAAATRVVALDWPSGGTPRATAAVTGAGPAVLRCALAGDAIALLTGEDRLRLRRCANPPCPMVFVAQHGRRRFCHPGCSHAVRQDRYRRRRGS
ncbi:ABATE domain-containing protein [Euzebya sp.]|uniref:CGNR zinc finger domain-containing protein n=1 Tax=Euzebya sp. TaxID=1971409 RepID=UPI003515A52D